VQSFGDRNTPISGFNAQNQVCGWSGQAIDHEHAFRYTPGIGIKDLGYIAKNRGGYGQSWGWGLDDNGQVVGFSTAGGRSFAAFRYTDAEGMVNLGALGVSGGSRANAITPSGSLIVGGAPTAGGSYHAFLYDTAAKKMMDLEAAIVDFPPAYVGKSTTGAWKINEVGQVLLSLRPTGTSPILTFVLTPVTP